MRQPDEHREELWAFLLQRNARMYGVAFAIDTVGDVYLTGRTPLHAVTPDELDRLLGSVLTLRRRHLRHDAGDRLRQRRSGASGPGGSRAASRWPTCRPSRHLIDEDRLR